MALEIIDDYVDNAITRSITQYKERPNITGLLDASTEGKQEIENEAFILYNERWIATATGDLLNIAGEIVGEPRLGRDDINYRAAIQARILINVSGGEPESIMNAIRSLLNPVQVIYTEQWPAAFQLDIRIENYDPLYTPIIKSLAPAGVAVNIIISSPFYTFVWAERVLGEQVYDTDGTDALVPLQVDPNIADSVFIVYVYSIIPPTVGTNLSERVPVPLLLDIGGGQNLDIGNGEFLEIFDENSKDSYIIEGGGRLAERLP